MGHTYGMSARTASATDTAPSWRRHYPFRSRRLSIEGRQHHYLDEGEGEVLLLVHGNPTWSFHWRELIRSCRGSYRLVAPDHLGCGLSDKPRDADYRLAAHIDRMVRMIESLDLHDITLVVHDWGGPIGLGAALRMPQRFARLVLLNTGAFPPPYIPWRIRACRIPIFGTLAVRGLNLFARAALRMAMCHPDRLTPSERQAYLAPYDNWNNRLAIERFVRDIPGTARHPTHATLAEIERMLPRLADLPTQIIWGMQDWCFRPDCLRRLRQILPQAAVHEIAGAGHWVMEDAREEILRLLPEFLRHNPLRKPGGHSSGTPSTQRSQQVGK